MKIGIGQTDHVTGFGLAAVGSNGPVGDDEAAFGVLHPQVVGHPVDQRLQRDLLVDDQAIGGEFRYVLMRGHPSAVRHRLMADLNCPAVGEICGPVSQGRARIDRPGKCEISVAGHRGCPGSDAAFDDFAQRPAGAQVFGRDAVNFRIAAVAQDQPFSGVEKADALRDVVDRRLESQRLLLECCDRSPEFALERLVRGARQFRQRGKLGRFGRLGGLPR